MQFALFIMPDESNDQIDSGQDMSRQLDPSKYTLSAEEASRLFSNAGVPRAPRTIDRYCKSGHLVCMKIDTERNDATAARCPVHRGAQDHCGPAGSPAAHDRRGEWSSH